MSVSKVETRGTSAEAVAQALAEWFETEPGRAVVEQESDLLHEGARRFHGDSMLWLGPVALARLDFERCMVRQRVFGAFCEGSAKAAQVSAYVGDLENLPFTAASLDAVALHHALDCVHDSRLVMREVARVLRPGGRLLICGFNPYSLWGLRPYLARLLPRDPFRGSRFVSPLRLLDWLTILGLEIDQPLHYLAYGPFPGSARSESRAASRLSELFARWKLPFGGVYTVLAHKNATAGIDSGAQVRGFRKRPTLVPTPLPKPTARYRA